MSDGGPGGLAALCAAARAAGDPGRLAAAIPFGARFGLGAELAADGGLRGRLRFGPEIVGNPTLPAIHGGAIGALLESTAIFQLLWDGAPAVPKTISLTIDFLRSARPLDTFARGIVTRQGRRVANVRVEAWQDDPDRPVAIAHGHFLLAGDAA